MASIKIIAKKRGTRKDGRTPVYVQYSYDSNTRTLINTGFKIEPKYWSYNSGLIKSSYPFEKERDTINEVLKKMVRKGEDIISDASNKGIVLSVAEFTKEFSKDDTGATPGSIENLYELLDAFTERSRKRVVPNVIQDYVALKRYLQDYEKYARVKLKFQSFNYHFYQDFVEYLTYYAKKRNGEVGYTNNSIGKVVKTLKTFLNDLMRREIISKINLRDYKVLEEDVDAIYLDEDEVNRIWSLDLSHRPDLIKYRDAFVLSCYTGLRFSDYTQLIPANIRGEFIYKTQKKTSDKVIIPMNDVVQGIMQKYGNQMPSIKEQKLNEYVKEFGKMAEIEQEILITKKKGNQKVETLYKKYELISSHTGRRSFCTNEYLKGTPTFFIMKISGHKTESAFLKYIKVGNEEAARKMMEIWQKRG